MSAEVKEATLAECVNIARRDIEHALDYLDDLPTSHDADHVRNRLISALVWLPDDLRDGPEPTAREPHEATMIGRR